MAEDRSGARTEVGGDAGETGDDRLVSVVIPVYNAERYLGEAIESVLGQSYRPLEVIVVDDGSTDGSAQVAASFGAAVRCRRQSNQGIGSARNAGVAMARGGFLAFLDADDLWEEGKLAAQVAALEADPDLDMVFGMVEHFFSPELPAEARARLVCPEKALRGLLAGAMTVRRSSFFRVGLFEPHWRIGEFIDWYSRAGEAGLKGLVLDQVVMRRRVHGENTVLCERGTRGEYARVLKASLDRRRKQGIRNG